MECDHCVDRKVVGPKCFGYPHCETKLLKVRNAELEAAISSAHRHLTNLQPAIDQFVAPKERVFIDTHVDAALEVLGGVAGGVRFHPLQIS